MSLTTDQRLDIVVTERLASVLSLIGSAFVLITFTLNDKFRKPINRLVFYATFGNVIVNVATLISVGGIEAGEGSALCSFQGFLIQWFMPADALWTFAMACNVWLSFFRSHDTVSLRRLEVVYAVACYGLPFVPAFTYLFVNTHERGKIYGSAVLWCWVSLRWDFLRVATFYGPVWIVILATLAIYLHVGTIIFKWRKQLLSLDRTNVGRDAGDFPATGIMKTSEVTVTRTDDNYRPDSTHINENTSYLGSSGAPQLAAQSHVHRPNGGIDPNKAALKYCKCALLFFCALAITWIPSTVNRVYTIVKPTELVFGLNLAAATVLPLQGFWNAIVYLSTSTFAMKSLWEDIRHVWSRKPVATRTSIQMRRQASSIRSDDVEDAVSKHSTMSKQYGLDRSYDGQRSSSQSELVGTAQ